MKDGDKSREMLVKEPEYNLLFHWFAGLLKAQRAGVGSVLHDLAQRHRDSLKKRKISEQVFSCQNHSGVP